MSLSYRNLLLSLLATSFITMLVSNWIGYHIAITESIPGVLILVGIAFIGICLGKLIPLNIPVIVYVVLFGLVISCPISPISSTVVEQTGKISSMAIITLVGTLAGIGLDFKSFRKQSWKMFIIAILVFTGAFLIQAIFAETFLRLTNG
ncbi:hypothetical protein [Niallia nealsonii]|uniref:Uncharacterized protein n=1 Tax=Niallia nealsonii TaxID=115979 RepID=A0A2N0YWN1_9BACI|nr:hypothetical protein [Niallia nealsonii]PKG21660.1 hypothetical protein CWS01_21050 [Niallia nealsonii]